MVRITVIPPEDASGPLREEYEAAQRRAGRVWHILRLMSVNPAALHSTLGQYRTLMFGASPLSRGQREMLAVVVSRTNGCRY